MTIRASTGTTIPPTGTATSTVPGEPGGRALMFADEYAPVWTDPDTGQRKPMTSTAWIAAGFDVRAIPGHTDLYVVDLDSRRRALPDGPSPNVDDPPRDSEYWA